MTSWPALELALDDARPGGGARPGSAVDGVEHLGPAGVGGDRAGVADLAAGLGVEGRAVEHDGTSSAHGRCTPRPSEPRTPRGPTNSVGPNCSSSSCEGSSASSSRPPLLRASLARRPLLGHLGVEAGLVDVDAALGRDLLGELEREAVGVVQQEGDGAGERRRPRRARPARCRGWPSRVRRVRAEPLLLAVDDARARSRGASTSSG